MNIPFFEYYCHAIFFNFYQIYTTYQNKHFNNQAWHRVEWWFIRVGFERKLYGTENLRYDGNTLRGIIFLGLWVGLYAKFSKKRL